MSEHLDLEDLRSFAQVVRYGGFSAAERATGQPKAKLSRRVSRLEADLGARLIERSTRSLRITEVGQEIYRQCEVIADSVAATRAIAGRARSTVSGHLRICCPAGLVRYLGPNLLSSFLLRHPDVRLEMYLSSRRVDLIRERFDAAIRVEQEGPRDETLIMRRLGAMECILVAAPGLVASLPLLTVEALATVPTLALGDQIERTRWTLCGTEGRRSTVVHHPRLVSNDSLVIREAAIDGLGVALLPRLACIAELERGALVQILPDWHAPDGSIHVVFTATRGMSHALRTFIDHLVHAFAEASANAREAKDLT